MKKFAFNKSGFLYLLAILLLSLFLIPYFQNQQISHMELNKQTYIEDFWTVSHVIDGDTIILKRANEKIKARLIGVNTPELDGPYTKKECFGKEASQYAKKELLGKKVYIKFDPSQSKFDKYGRALVYVYTKDGELFNKKLIESGYAYEFTYKGVPYKYQKEFKNAQKTAKKLKRGLWGKACIK